MLGATTKTKKIGVIFVIRVKIGGTRLAHFPTRLVMFNASV